MLSTKTTTTANEARKPDATAYFPSLNFKKMLAYFLKFNEGKCFQVFRRM